MYTIYKYVKDNYPIYIGKTTRPLNLRINEHKSRKDLPEECEIFYAECCCEADMNILEIYLIDKYKPKYNKDCNTYGEPCSTFKIPEPCWENYSSYTNAPLWFLQYETSDSGIRKVFLKGNKKFFEPVSLCTCCDGDYYTEYSEGQVYSVCSICGCIKKGSLSEWFGISE